MGMITPTEPPWSCFRRTLPSASTTDRPDACEGSCNSTKHQLQWAKRSIVEWATICEELVHCDLCRTVRDFHTFHTL